MASINHPLSVGDRIKTLHGEEDSTGTCRPGSIGEITLVDRCDRQGWMYHVDFPVHELSDEAQSLPEDERSDVVCVVLDEVNELYEGQEEYEVLEPPHP